MITLGRGSIKVTYNDAAFSLNYINVGLKQGNCIVRR